MGMVVISLYCMIFYSVLIILSMFQTDRGSEGSWGGRAEGTVHGDSFLPSLLLWSGSEYLSSITAWSLFWCSELSRPRHKIVTTCGWGLGEAVEESCVLHRGTWGDWGIGAMSVI